MHMLPPILEAIIAKATSQHLDHVSYEERVRQAVLDTYLVLTDPQIREAWETELRSV